jgi:hypothetical protein
MIESVAVSCDFFDPAPEQQNVVLIDVATLHEAERLIESCELLIPMALRFPSIGCSIALPAQIRA